MEDNKLTLFDAKNVGKKVLDSWAYILLGLILFLTVLSGYTNVGLDLLAAVNLGIDYAILLLFCYGSMYSLDAIAKKRGSEDPRYITAAEKVAHVRGRLKNADVDLLQEFCEEYRTAELSCTRNQILSEAMLTGKQFDEYLKSGALPKDAPLVQKLALRRAKACKPIKLNRYMIGRPLSATHKRPTFDTPEQTMKRGSLARVLSTALTVIFPVSISLSVIVEPTLATFVAGLLKVFTVTFAGFKAYYGRMKNMTEGIPSYAEIQEDITDRFEAWAAQKIQSDTLASPLDNGTTDDEKNKK